MTRHVLANVVAERDQWAGIYYAIRRGDDIYVVNSSGDSVNESGGNGSDVVKSSVGYTLGANVEILTLSGTANSSGTGNGLANIINGNSGANRLDGRAGADTLKGGGGNDTYSISKSAPHSGREHSTL